MFTKHGEGFARASLSTETKQNNNKWAVQKSIFSTVLCAQIVELQLLRRSWLN